MQGEKRGCADNVQEGSARRRRKNAQVPLAIARCIIRSTSGSIFASSSSVVQRKISFTASVALCTSGKWATAMGVGSDGLDGGLLLFRLEFDGVYLQ
jgi:hypothetical protein